jgi:hypothetical protein
MNTSFKIIAISAFLGWTSLGAALASDARDGSSEAKAILVPVDYAHFHEWERDYLKKHFPAHFAPGRPVSEVGEDHEFVAHEEQGKWCDCYSFTMRGKKVKVYFNISRLVEEQYARSHPKR